MLSQRLISSLNIEYKTVRVFLPGSSDVLYISSLKKSDNHITISMCLTGRDHYYVVRCWVLGYSCDVSAVMRTGKLCDSPILDMVSEEWRLCPIIPRV